MQTPIVYNDLNSLNRLKGQSAEKPREALHEASRQFEALFVSMVIKSMRDTLPKDGMFSSNSMDTYQQMFDQQLALDLSRRGGLGLSELIARQLSAGIRPEEGGQESGQERGIERGKEDGNG